MTRNLLITIFTQFSYLYIYFKLVQTHHFIRLLSVYVSVQLCQYKNETAKIIKNYGDSELP